MLKIKTQIIVVFLLVGIYTKLVGQEAGRTPNYNVLFIFIDDLRPELGCYGNNQIYSPHIDSFANGASVFNRHFVVVPTCGPSRATLLTGMRPRNTEELSNDVLEIKKRKGLQDTERSESFVENFKRNGYYTIGIGKISHSPDGNIYKYLAPKTNDLELPNSWNEMLLDAGKWGTGWNAFFGYANGLNRNELKNEVKPYESAEVDDEGYPDGLTAALAVQKLEELATNKKPFFLGVGFFKPHLPFNAPKKYWDLYDQSTLKLTPSPGIPLNVNPASLHESGEFNAGYKKGDEKASLAQPVPDEYARKLIHGYYASASYVDAQVGKVLSALKKHGLEKNTIIILWGDHGWHLGDQRVWGKHTLSEWSLRSPLIIKTPDMKKGTYCDKIVSSIDIYPTLMELCGIGLPYKTDGKSLGILLKDPANKNWVNEAFSYFKRGITLRTEQYRYTKYFRKEEPVIELYNHINDPYENNNIAADHESIIRSLEPLWKKGNTGLYKY